MNRLFSFIRKLSFFLCFSLVLATFSTSLVSYSLKGEEHYLKDKIHQNQISLDSIIKDIDSYTIETRNNTTYITIHSSLEEQSNIALLTRLYDSLDINTYPIQLILHYPNNVMWVTINHKGISITK